MEFLSYIVFIQEAAQQSAGALNWLQEKYIAGGFFMHPILGTLVFGLAFSIERFWTLNRASINTKKFIGSVRQALDQGGVPAALEVCKSSRGSIASVFQAGLMRADESIEAAEKAIISYGGIEMAFLEKGLVWISLMISLAPLLGFTGTVQGMIEAFDAIKEAKNISPEIVAGGISIALLTTLFGLVVAMMLQVFYNFFVSRIDRLVIDMEESSIQLIDSLVLLKANKKSANREARAPVGERP